MLNKGPMEGNDVRADSEQVASAPTGIRHTSSHRGILDIGPGDDHLSEIRAQSSRKLATRRASQAPGHPCTSLMPTSHTRSVTPHIAADQRNVDRSVARSPSSRRSVATRHHPIAEYVQAHGRGPELVDGWPASDHRSDATGERTVFESCRSAPRSHR